MMAGTVAQLTQKAQLSPKATEDLAAAIIKVTYFNLSVLIIYLVFFLFQGMTFYTTLALESVTTLRH